MSAEYDEPTHSMFLIKSLDADAALRLSDYTGQWYVSARIEIGNGAFLTGPNEHRDTPTEAVAAYVARLRRLADDEYIVVNADHDNRRHYRWNGAAFAEIPIKVSA